MKISILGVSRSGKTCYISAMSQVLKNCNLGNGCRVSLKTNDIAKQLELDNNFMSMATEREWPKGTDTTTSYDFRIHFQSQDASLQLPSLTMDDYRGGMLNGMGKQDKIDRDSFIESLSDTAVITFLIDGTTVLNAMDELDKDATHRGETQASEKLAAINEISIMENILYQHQFYQLINLYWGPTHYLLPNYKNLQTHFCKLLCHVTREHKVIAPSAEITSAEGAVLLTYVVFFIFPTFYADLPHQ